MKPKTEEDYRRQNGYARAWYSKKKAEIFEALGGKCVRCGFSDIRALQIDHIHGGGRNEIQRMGWPAYYKKVLDASEGYQLLCANCNWIKRSERKESAKGRPRGLPLTAKYGDNL